ncbi:MAG: ferrochelatase [Actinobacteria bacterium]|nr:ferrochelatase [Actinomycetota bacterium]MBU1608330.1 ferrochelatase [Actinomycetota bacterium]MBU2316834.1 ferrochelatase [Actinomycetota bacterium]MBU2385951.1 ferrochelatase [Actinomycetota bacterium]
MTISNNGLGPDGKAVVVDLADGHYEGEQFARAATDTAQAFAVPGRVEAPVAYDAVILAGFGGPEGQDDVIPFLRNVTRGRGIPDERLEEVAHHYRHFGGVSPINEQNRQLQAALQAEADRRGLGLPIYWGNRNWDPYLPQALQQAFDDGHRTILGLATSAYSSFSSCRQYREDFAKALDATGLWGQVRIDKVAQFFDAPGFVAPFVTGVADALRELLAAGTDLAATRVLFATHSIPTTDAERSGPRDVDWGEGGAYAAQHLAVSEVIMQRALATLRDEGADVPEVEWQLVYQSRSGPPTQPWLEPDINDAIGEHAAAGATTIVMVPVGFVSDHMEVMWDLDTEAMETCEEHGVAGVRVPTPGVDPVYVSGLVDLIEERLRGTPTVERVRETTLGPWYDVCRPGCCENVRAGYKPAISGLQP